MARYTGPSCKLCRREGKKLFLKGDRCLTDKCAVVRRSTVPGQHGAGRKTVKEYGLQFREKQTAKRYYGVQEKQFKSYFAEADRVEGMTGENLIKLIERRLDNVVYRMGMAESRKEARQLVLHEHFELNELKEGELLNTDIILVDNPMPTYLWENMGAYVGCVIIEFDNIQYYINFADYIKN